MPPEEICDQCPNSEYKSIKKRYRRASPAPNATLSPTLASSIMPASLYTCKKPVDYSKNPDYVRCLTCLADGDESADSECRNPTNGTKMAHKWCNSITHKCFAKSLTVNGTMREFSRGCASLNELGERFAQERPSAKATCVGEGQGSEACVLLCDTHLCNDAVEVKGEEVVDAASKGARPGLSLVAAVMAAILMQVLVV